MIPAPSKEPRRGLLGWWDRLAGPDASVAENVLNLSWSVAFTIWVLTYSLTHDLGWNVVQLAVVGLFAFDLAGGVSVNASPAAKRWWHRPGQGTRQHLTFVAGHLHPFVLALSFPAFGWAEAASMYLYVILAAATILASPPLLKRPVAFIACTVALVLAFYAWPLVDGLAWFAPVYFLKLLLAHLLGPDSHAPTPPEQRPT